MPNYDFHALLEPLEFEKLVCDIVQTREDIFVETFKEGRDMGIDGSYTNHGKTTIIQAKRYQQNFKILFNELKRNELPKVRKLKPHRYILGVSIDFGPGEKEDIIKLFDGYITNVNDIISRANINRLLETPKYKWVELAHPKLWQLSTTVLEKIISQSAHRAIYKESAEELKEALKTSKTFVPTRIYRKALQSWIQNHVIVLSGEPGVGKTSMAYMLALANLQPNHLDGFVWANSIQDVYSMLEDDKKQVIILDDFWGSIFHDEHHTHRNDENRLNKLIQRLVETKGQKRLILTTREYVLQQGLQKHPQLKETMDLYALICTVENYSEAERADILFRHIYSSNLDYEYVEYLYKKSDRIVAHQNYNPRVLSLFLKKKIAADCSPETYYDQLDEYFDNPDTFWEEIFTSLSSEAKTVAILLLISSTPMRIKDMEICYHKFIQVNTHPTAVKSLGGSISELEETMIKSFCSEEEEMILLKFSMPAVQDFLYKYISIYSEHYIPLLLECCAFYNQLLFLLEHFFSYCSNITQDLIIQQCIVHYYDYPNSSMEYDGSWNWEVDLYHEEEQLHNFFHLLRFCDCQNRTVLFQFLENKIHDYCNTMGRNNLEAQYFDLHNLPDIIVRCINKGMFFNGQEIIESFFKEAFSVHHYLAMQNFQKVFPNEYDSFYKNNYYKVKSSLRNIILDEIEFLEDTCMEYQLDMFIDSIPDILHEFGLRYTKSFEAKIYELCGTTPQLQTSKFRSKKSLYREIDQEKQSFENVKENARNWLFGPDEVWLEEQEIADLISNSYINPMLKAELMKVLDRTSSQYVYDFLQTEASTNLLMAALNESCQQLPRLESHLHMIILRHLVQGDQELLIKLVGFCAESFMMIMYREEPVIRVDQFESSDIYAHYLVDNELLREIVFTHLFLQDELWIRFIHLPCFIFCYAFILCFDYMDEQVIQANQEAWRDIWGDNSAKLKYAIKENGRIDSSIYYMEYGVYNFKRNDWESRMYRVFEELNPFDFNQFYVYPRIKEYLTIIGNKNDERKVLNHLSLCKIKFEYTRSGNPYSSMYEVTDELHMIDCLDIAKGWDPYPEKIPKAKWKQLQLNEDICKRDNDNWTLLVYKITDIELLKELGIYSEILKFINKIESVSARFSNSDYSTIERDSYF